MNPENPIDTRTGSMSLTQWLRTEAGWVLTVFVASRAFVFATIHWSRMTMHRGHFWHPGELLSILVQGEGERYVAFLRSGHRAAVQSGGAVALFPGYPLLAKAANALFRDPEMAAVVASNLSLLGAGLLLNELTKLDFADVKLRRRAVLFLMFSPASFLFSCARPDATFLMLSIASVLAATRRQWLLASALGMALAATHIAGIAILVPLTCEHVRQVSHDRDTPRARLFQRALLLALVPCGIVLVAWYAWSQLDDPANAFRAAFAYHRDVVSADNRLAFARDYDHRYPTLFIGYVAAAIGLLLAAIRLRVRLSHIAYAAVLIIAAVSFGSLDSAPRNLSLVFPLFIGLGAIATRFDMFYEAFLGISVGVLTFWTVLFANGQYVI